MARMKKTELKSFAAEKILKMRKIKGKSGKHTMVKYQIKFHGYIKKFIKKKFPLKKKATGKWFCVDAVNRIRCFSMRFTLKCKSNVLLINRLDMNERKFPLPVNCPTAANSVKVFMAKFLCTSVPPPIKRLS